MFKLGTFEKAMFYQIKERGLRAILFNLFIMLVRKLRPAWRGEVSYPRSVAGLVWNLGLQFLAHLLLFLSHSTCFCPLPPQSHVREG